LLYYYDNSGDPFPAKALKEIRISGGNFCKSFDFGHSYFYDDQLLQGDYGTGISSVGSVYNLHSDKKRLKLDSVQERSCDNTVLKPAHIFEYFEETEVPRTLSLAQDHWGFYNGATTNTRMLPDIATDGGWI